MVVVVFQDGTVVELRQVVIRDFEEVVRNAEVIDVVANGCDEQGVYLKESTGEIRPPRAGNGEEPRFRRTYPGFFSVCCKCNALR